MSTYATVGTGHEVELAAIATMAGLAGQNDNVRWHLIRALVALCEKGDVNGVHAGGAPVEAKVGSGGFTGEAIRALSKLLGNF